MFYVAHMETELKSHSFQHRTLGSYVPILYGSFLCTTYYWSFSARRFL